MAWNVLCAYTPQKPSLLTLVAIFADSVNITDDKLLKINGQAEHRIKK